jgi:hypothetical protein
MYEYSPQAHQPTHDRTVAVTGLIGTHRATFETLPLPPPRKAASTGGHGH